MGCCGSSNRRPSRNSSSTSVNQQPSKPDPHAKSYKFYPRSIKSYSPDYDSIELANEQRKLLLENKTELFTGIDSDRPYPKSVQDVSTEYREIKYDYGKFHRSVFEYTKREIKDTYPDSSPNNMTFSEPDVNQSKSSRSKSEDITESRLNRPNDKTTSKSKHMSRSMAEEIAEKSSAMQSRSLQTNEGEKVIVATSATRFPIENNHININDLKFASMPMAQGPTVVIRNTSVPGKVAVRSKSVLHGGTATVVTRKIPRSISMEDIISLRAHPINRKQSSSPSSKTKKQFEKKN